MCPLNRFNTGGIGGGQDETVITGKRQLVPQFEDLVADEDIEHEDENNEEPGLSLASDTGDGFVVCSLPYWSVVEDYTEKYPFRRDGAPELWRTVII